MATSKTKYRLQRSDHHGVVTRAFGGRVVSWGKWQTVETHPGTPEGKVMAEAAFDSNSGRGLTRWRLVYGGEVVKKSL